ncbi:MAG TPA: hypothetical protein VMS22_14360 [Candidatus Eisenbacteria bacterium]|nr:hypothetical protein [Candidatus Eisenbacteria bacterium]
MTCDEVGTLIDAFVDTELPSATLLEVACHAGHCARCERAVQDVLAIREVLVADVDRQVEGLDLSGVWSHVDAAIARTEGQAHWRQRGDAKRGRLPRSIPVWGSIAAIAAGAALYVRPIGPVAVTNPAPSAVRVASKRLPNHVYIDRLAGKDIALRREAKSGTTIIWVNHEVEGSGW